MKGTITSCLLEMLDNQVGRNKSEEIVKKSGAKATFMRLASSDVADEDFFKLFNATIEDLGLSKEAACDAFGEYWCCTYAPRIYKPIVRRFSNAREMLLGMEKVHDDVTKSIENARPPRFSYAWENDRTLCVTYQSDRDLVDVYIGLVRGVGTYFNESLKVTKLDSTRVRIEFPEPQLGD